jgi:hypothetical protein
MGDGLPELWDIDRVCANRSRARGAATAKSKLAAAKTMSDLSSW